MAGKAIARQKSRQPKAKNARRLADFYPTPPEAIDALILWLLRNPRGLPPVDWRRGIVDPAAGHGAILSRLADWGFPPTLLGALELRAPAALVLREIAWTLAIGDSLALPWPAMHAIQNPPFALIDPFLARTIDHVDRFRVWSFVLAPSGLFHAKKRADLWAARRPAVKLDLTWRPSFTADGQTDAHNVSWYVWTPFPVDRTIVELLPRPDRLESDFARHVRGQGPDLRIAQPQGFDQVDPFGLKDRLRELPAR